MLTSFCVVPFQVERDAGIEMGFIQIRRDLKRLSIQSESFVLLSLAIQLLALFNQIQCSGRGGLRGAKDAGEQKKDESAQHGGTSETKLILRSGGCGRGQKGMEVSTEECAFRAVRLRVRRAVPSLHPSFFCWSTAGVVRRVQDR